MNWKNLTALVLAGFLASCGGGAIAPSGATVSVSISGLATPLSSGASRMFSATVNHASNTAVTWSVVEANGGSITQAGIYTAPATPGTYTVKAVALANASASATAPVPVVIPEGNIPGYSVG